MKLPASAPAAFRLAAAELGHCSAARLFTTELLASGGADLLREAQDALGSDFPVLDLVADEALSDRPPAPIDAEAAARALRDPASLLVVGLEAFYLDALVPLLPGTRVGLVLGEGGLEGDVRRMVANFGDRVEEVRLGDIQRWAGNRSALLTFLYGCHENTGYVTPVWLRVAGSDVRTQFRTLVGWDILGRPTSLYPRWLVEAPLEPFSRVVTP
ncbi:MAG: hypothetical protein R3B70_39835 [Polyangiaceae bacterium]